jgi:hypothetical protein
MSIIFTKKQKVLSTNFPGPNPYCILDYLFIKTHLTLCEDERCDLSIPGTLESLSVGHVHNNLQGHTGITEYGTNDI